MSTGSVQNFILDENKESKGTMDRAKVGEIIRLVIVIVVSVIISVSITLLYVFHKFNATNDKMDILVDNIYMNIQSNRQSLSDKHNDFRHWHMNAMSKNNATMYTKLEEILMRLDTVAQEWTQFKQRDFHHELDMYKTHLISMMQENENNLEIRLTKTSDDFNTRMGRLVETNKHLAAGLQETNTDLKNFKVEVESKYEKAFSEVREEMNQVKENLQAVSTTATEMVENHKEDTKKLLEHLSTKITEEVNKKFDDVFLEKLKETSNSDAHIINIVTDIREKYYGSVANLTEQVSEINNRVEDASTQIEEIVGDVEQMNSTLDAANEDRESIKTNFGQEMDDIKGLLQDKIKQREFVKTAFTDIDGSLYYFSKSAASFHNAQLMCLKVGAHLTEFKDEDTFQKVGRKYNVNIC